MKRLIVRACGNSSLEDIRASIEARLPYAQFHESLESFRMLTFDIPDENIDQVKNDVHGCGHKCSWDQTVSLDPVEEEVIDIDVESEVSLEASQDTNWVTSSGGTYQYVRVVQSNGSPVFEFSSSSSGPWSKWTHVTAGGAGYTYFFLQRDPSNIGYPLRFSETPDGTHKGGVEYTALTNDNAYSPGNSNHQRNLYMRGKPTHNIGVQGHTPAILYMYCPNQPNMGRYQDSPVRYGTINYPLSAWHLDRISKNDRSRINNQFTYTHDGDGVDIYVIDSGVRGAKRPTGSTAALHPELYDPDNRSNLTGTSEQGDYRVYELSHFTGYYTGDNDDDNGHGTYCAILASGWRYGVAKKARIYALKVFDSGGSGSLSGIASAYQAVIDHNNPSSSSYKGNNRPAIINASLGVNLPSGSTPVIELNDVGTDYPYNDQEVLDEIESTVCRSHNIIICRSAGNGFLSASDSFLGPLQAKMQAGKRTGGPQDLRFNNVDYDQPKIVVGATDYGDFVADFSNYGNSVDVYAPGTRIKCPRFEWSANTSYTSNTSTNYGNISGTSFSTPIVAGMIAAWLDYNNYDATTSNLPQKAKDWIRSINPGHRVEHGGTDNYPINLMDERKLVNNPFSSTNGSSQIVVKFNPVDSAHFLGNVGKKVQIRTPLPPEPLTYVGNINMTEALMTWWGIIGEDSFNNSITIDLGSSYVATSTNVDVGGNGPFSMGIITNTHQETDGPVFGGVSLETRTDTQESNNTGTSVGTGLPLDAGYYNPANKSFTASKFNGAIFPYVEKTFTWAQAQGTLSQSPIANGSVVNINLGYSSALTSGTFLSTGETVDVGPWTITGDSLTSTNLIFNTSTGYLQSPASNSYFQDTSFNITVTDTSTGNAQTYSFTLTGSGVNNIRSFTGSSSVVSGNLEFGSQCASELDKFWKVNPAIDSNWALAFAPGNNHLNNATHQNGTKRYGNHTFAYTSADSDLKFTVGNQHDSNWTDQTPPPTLNYTMSLTSAEARDQALNKKAFPILPPYPTWTAGYRPGSFNYTLTYLNPTVYVSPGRPTALLGFGQIYPRFFEEVDEETVPAETASGAGLAEITYTTNNSPPAPAMDTMDGLRTSREMLKDKRPRVGQAFPRGNAFRSDEN